VRAHGVDPDRLIAADSAGTGLICAKPAELERLADDPQLELLQMAQVDSWSPAG
jgi:hypothetical protein